MAHRARISERMSRRSWLLAGLGVPLFRLGASETLAVTFDGDNVHVSAPDVHFLSGKPLARLRDASTVVFLSKITLFSDNQGTVLRQVPERLIISYDLWEEKFSVTIPGAGPRTRSNLTADQAEAWCMENLLFSAAGIAPDRPFWLRLDLRTASQKDLPRVLGDSGISLPGLIEIIARKPGADDSYWSRSGGPFRLSELHRTAGRGTRSG
jgi:hypothetical protein